MERQRFEELSAAHVLGALEEDERQELEAALRGGPVEFKRLHAELSYVAMHLPLAVEWLEPPYLTGYALAREVKGARLFGAENIVATVASWFGLHRPLWSLSLFASMCVLVVGTTSLSFWMRGRLKNSQGESKTLTRQLETRTRALGVANLQLKHQARRLKALRTELARKTALLKILRARQIEVVSMGVRSLRRKNKALDPKSYGKIIWSPKKREALLQVSHLAQVPKDKDYQLWIIKRGRRRPISAGVFAVKDKRDEFFKIENMAEGKRRAIAMFAITLEPKGGRPQPTGAMVLLGKAS